MGSLWFLLAELKSASRDELTQHLSHLSFQEPPPEAVGPFERVGWRYVTVKGNHDIAQNPEKKDIELILWIHTIISIMIWIQYDTAI